MNADYVPGVQGGNMNYGHVVEGQLFGYLPFCFDTLLLWNVGSAA